MLNVLRTAGEIFLEFCAIAFFCVTVVIVAGLIIGNANGIIQ